MYAPPGSGEAARWGIQHGRRRRSAARKVALSGWAVGAVADGNADAASPEFLRRRTASGARAGALGGARSAAWVKSRPYCEIEDSASACAGWASTHVGAPPAPELARLLAPAPEGPCLQPCLLLRLGATSLTAA